MPFPCFFLDDELAYLRGSPLEDVVRRYRADVVQKFAIVKREVLSQDSQAFPPWAFNLETYQWASAILDSRSIWWGGRRHLVPLLDLINCAESESPKRVHSTQLQRLRPLMGAGNEERGNFVLDKGVEFAVTRSDREYESSGMQLWENYGQPNWVCRLINTPFFGYGLCAP
jgi:histone-lysine N-methyltransferase SETD3